MRVKPEVLTELALQGGAVVIDGSNYIVDPDAWTPEFATVTAKRENIELTDLHWSVFSFMRDFYTEHGVAADSRFAIKYLSATRGITKSEAKKLLFELFPYGYVKQACKIAGMKQPRAWSTG